MIVVSSFHLFSVIDLKDPPELQLGNNSGKHDSCIRLRSAIYQTEIFKIRLANDSWKAKIINSSVSLVFSSDVIFWVSLVNNLFINTV